MNKRITTIKFLYVATVLAIIIGTVVRFYGLSKSPLAIDEYYLASAILNILEHGLPEFPHGGLYTRGILLQYLAAPVLYIDTHPEFYLRLGAAIANLLALPALFLIARRAGGTTVACITVIFFSLSIWQIEFSRFARMYAPFFVLFAWTLYFSYRSAIDHEIRFQKWAYLLTAISIFVYEGSVFLIIISTLPLFMQRHRIPWSMYLTPVLLLIVAFLWAAIDFRFLGSSPVPQLDPEQGASNSLGPLDLGPILATTIPLFSAWWFGFIALILAFIGYQFVIVRNFVSTRRTPNDFIFPCLLFMGMLFATLNYFVPAVLMMLFVGWFEITREKVWRSSDKIYTVIFIIAALLFWSLSMVLSDYWREGLDISRPGILKNLILMCFGFPKIFQKIVEPWFAAMPIQTSLIAVISLFGTIRAFSASETQAKSFAYLFICITICAVLVGALNQPFVSTRYTYFLYGPIMLIVAMALYSLAGLCFRGQSSVVAGTAVLALAFILASEDFSFRHMTGIASDRVIYRMGIPGARAEQYYPRWDFRGAAEYVNANGKSNDIVISSLYSVPYYLDHMDFMYIDQKSARYRGIAVHGGKYELWTGGQLLSSREELHSIISECEASAWAIVSSRVYNWATDGELMLMNEFGRYRDFTSKDGRIDVYRIPCEKVSRL